MCPVVYKLFVVYLYKCVCMGMNVYMNMYVYMKKSRRTRRRDDATTEQGEEQHRHKKKFPAGVLCVAPGFTVNLYQTYKQTSVLPSQT